MTTGDLANVLSAIHSDSLDSQVRVVFSNGFADVGTTEMSLSEFINLLRADPDKDLRIDVEGARQLLGGSTPSA